MSGDTGTKRRWAERVLVVPVYSSNEANAHLVDWYIANAKSPGDRLIFVRVLVPEDYDTAVDCSSASSSTSSGSSTLMEEQMEKQLSDSVGQEERLVALLAMRGLKTFRFIHAFGRHFTETLLRIACEQSASLLLAPISSLADDSDVSYAFQLLRRSGLGVIYSPDAE